MTDPATMNAVDINSTSWALARRKSVRGHLEGANLWEWLAHEPEKEATFTHAMEGLGKERASYRNLG